VRSGIRLGIGIRIGNIIASVSNLLLGVVMLSGIGLLVIRQWVAATIIIVGGNWLHHLLWAWLKRRLRGR